MLPYKIWILKTKNAASELVKHFFELCKLFDFDKIYTHFKKTDKEWAKNDSCASFLKENWQKAIPLALAMPSLFTFGKDSPTYKLIVNRHTYYARQNWRYLEWIEALIECDLKSFLEHAKKSSVLKKEIKASLMNRDLEQLITSQHPQDKKIIAGVITLQDQLLREVEWKLSILREGFPYEALNVKLWCWEQQMWNPTSYESKNKSYLIVYNAFHQNMCIDPKKKRHYPVLSAIHQELLGGQQTPSWWPKAEQYNAWFLEEICNKTQRTSSLESEKVINFYSDNVEFWSPSKVWQDMEAMLTIEREVIYITQPYLQKILRIQECQAALSKVLKEFQIELKDAFGAKEVMSLIDQYRVKNWRLCVELPSSTRLVDPLYLAAIAEVKAAAIDDSDDPLQKYATLYGLAGELQAALDDAHSSKFYLLKEYAKLFKNLKTHILVKNDYAIALMYATALMPILFRYCDLLQKQPLLSWTTFKEDKAFGGLRKRVAQILKFPEAFLKSQNEKCQKVADAVAKPLSKIDQDHDILSAREDLKRIYKTIKEKGNVKWIDKRDFAALIKLCKQKTSDERNDEILKKKKT